MRARQELWVKTRLPGTTRRQDMKFSRSFIIHQSLVEFTTSRNPAIAYSQPTKMSISNVFNVALWLVLALVCWTLFSKLYQAYASPLRDVQGPWLARLTRFWYARSTYSRQGHKISMDLHKRYGPVVRIAPNEYSIDDFEASKIIYRSRDPLVKVC